MHNQRHAVNTLKHNFLNISKKTAATVADLQIYARTFKYAAVVLQAARAGSGLCQPAVLGGRDEGRGTENPKQYITADKRFLMCNAINQQTLRFTRLGHKTLLLHSRIQLSLCLFQKEIERELRFVVNQRNNILALKLTKVKVASLIKK